MKEQLMNVILGPVISEKATSIAETNTNRQFAFRVVNDASKPQIKKAVELLFKVKVESVQVLRVKSKEKRHGQTVGKRKGWKKAYVCLQAGFDINFMSAEK